MTVHPEMVEAVKFLNEYCTEMTEIESPWGKQRNYRLSRTNMRSLVTGLIDDLSQEDLSEERQYQLTQLLGFAVHNPEFIQAYFQ